jgi:hypothetical protein
MADPSQIMTGESPFQQASRKGDPIGLAAVAGGGAPDPGHRVRGHRSRTFLGVEVDPDSRFNFR